MKKYRIACDERLYYTGTEIEANSPEEAENKFMELWDNGDILVNKSEIVKLEVEEV